MSSTRIVKEVPLQEFKELIDNYKNRITINPHASFRLSRMQRKVYKHETLMGLLVKEKPILIGMQKNGNYAVFFKRKEGYIRLMFKVTQQCVEIITFYLVDYLPRL